MPESAKTLLVVLLIPFLMGLGHDIYFNYFSDDEKIREVKAMRIDPEAFLVSDLGWVWDNYAKDSMQTVRDSMEPQSFKSYLDPILRLPTMVVGLIPFALVAVYLLLARLIGFWPCSGGLLSSVGMGKKANFTVYKHAKGKTLKYKKK